MSCGFGTKRRKEDVGHLLRVRGEEVLPADPAPEEVSDEAVDRLDRLKFEVSHCLSVAFPRQCLSLRSLVLVVAGRIGWVSTVRVPGARQGRRCRSGQSRTPWRSGCGRASRARTYTWAECRVKRPISQPGPNNALWVLAQHHDRHHDHHHHDRHCQARTRESAEAHQRIY